MNIRQSIEVILASDLYANRKLHYRTEFQGFDVSIENRKGSIRRGVATDGTQWATKFRNPYGYIRKTEGTDGDHVDCFLGPNENARSVYIIAINDPKTGKYDEDKCFLGFDSAADARKCFDEHYDRPDKFFRDLSVMSIEAFRDHVLDRQNHGEKIGEEGQQDSGRGDQETVRAYTDFPAAMYPLDAPHPPSMHKKGKSVVDENVRRRMSPREMNERKRIL